MVAWINVTKEISMTKKVEQQEPPTSKKEIVAWAKLDPRNSPAESKAQTITRQRRRKIVQEDGSIVLTHHPVLADTNPGLIRTDH
jgi:hypothetical protein